MKKKRNFVWLIFIVEINQKIMLKSSNKILNIIVLLILANKINNYTFESFE
jgi:hypothetical protein